MKLVILYQPHSEHSRKVEEFVQNFNRVYPGNEVSLIDVDSIEGARQAEVYDIVQYPAIMALSSDGSVLNSWEGDVLPRADDVAGYLRS